MKKDNRNEEKERGWKYDFDLILYLYICEQIPESDFTQKELVLLDRLEPKMLGGEEYTKEDEEDIEEFIKNIN